MAVSALLDVIPVFLSTLSLRRATWVWMGGLSCDGNFYPRSPCGERRGWTLNINGPMKISIHALLAESDVALLRRITITVDISIHALLAESDPPAPPRRELYKDFYPRSPCGERQRKAGPEGPAKLPFLSTLSLRRATTGEHFKVVQIDISIHALLAESDASPGA